MVKYLKEQTTCPVIPINLYCDDFQCNPLGSHTYSICGFYYNFPTLPICMQSKLDFIIHAAFIESSLIKKCKYGKCFESLIQ